MLRFSNDVEIRNNPPEVETHKKCKMEEAVNSAICNFKHRDIVGAVQESKSRLGTGKFTSFRKRAEKSCSGNRSQVGGVRKNTFTWHNVVIKDSV